MSGRENIKRFYLEKFFGAPLTGLFIKVLQKVNLDVLKTCDAKTEYIVVSNQSLHR